MNYFMKIWVGISLAVILNPATIFAKERETWQDYVPTIQKYLTQEYKSMFREPSGSLKYPFIVPGSEQYPNILWDWDSWWTDVAIRQILLNVNSEKESQNAVIYEKGCVLNFLEYGGMDGWIPFNIVPGSGSRRDMKNAIIEGWGNLFDNNMHKPCLAQHAAFIIQNEGGDAEWLREKFYYLQSFVDAYYHHYRHRPTGLYVFANDKGTGTDNDPTQYYRPPHSTATPYLNSLMYKELLAMNYIAKQLDLPEIAIWYQKRAEELKTAMRDKSWDPLLGYYFSVDVNLLPVDGRRTRFHVGMPRHYDSLLMRFFTWTGFCTMWAGIATPEQAEIMVETHFADTTNLNSPFGIRTLSKQEKMYYVGGSGNPSSWLGPIWVVSNYMTFKGLIDYGFEKQAREIASETIVLLGRDIQKSGAMHEYYLPSNGEPVLNKGFLNWNCLVLNMIAWMQNEKVVWEY